MNKLNKVRIAVLLSVVMGIVITVVAIAGGFSVVSYSDVSSKGYNPSSVTTPQYIVNGDFNEWAGGRPAAWNMPDPVLGPNWEVHFSNVDLAASGGEEGRGISRAAGLFFRAGSAGSQYAGMSQQVGPGLVSGNHWVQVHITAWEERVTSAYNSVAWYGFGSTSDSSSVTEWRELFPDQRVCKNVSQACNYLGRKENIHVEAGSYMHVQMGMKFPDHQSWTVFVVDDISITDLSDGIDVDFTGFVDDGDIFWDADAAR
ncbi:MAG: hypothetical protein KAG66_17050 [Methylococcales bacterium]|nr:hypothetical protein [Methylococcales bacterium]